MQSTTHSIAILFILANGLIQSACHHEAFISKDLAWKQKGMYELAISALMRDSAMMQFAREQLGDNNLGLPNEFEVVEEVRYLPLRWYGDSVGGLLDRYILPDGYHRKRNEGNLVKELASMDDALRFPTYTDERMSSLSTRKGSRILIQFTGPYRRAIGGYVVCDLEGTSVKGSMPTLQPFLHFLVLFDELGQAVGIVHEMSQP